MQRRVARVLAEAGVLDGPRRLAEAGPAASEDPWLDRLGAALIELGPGYAAFGLYLASRPDLLSGSLCMRLAEACDRRRAVPTEEVGELIRDELGLPGNGTLEIGDAPVAAGLLYQSHRTRAGAGWVRILREPDLHGFMDGVEGAGLNALAPVLGLGRSAFGAARADFQRALRAWLDVRRHAELLEELGRETADGSLLAPPRPRDELLSERVLLVEWPEEPLAAGGASLASRRGFARRVALAWLELALIAGMVVVEADWLELADGRVSLLPREVARLGAESRARLWEYVRRTAEDRPSEAAAFLLPELDGRAGRPDAADLERRLRQIVPFRDGRWSAEGETLGEHLALHRRAAAECGYHPGAPLAAFWRGLFGLARIGHRLVPESDPLREAVTDFHWRIGWHGVRRMSRPAQIQRSAEANLLAMLELPERIDQLLDRAELWTGGTPAGAGTDPAAGPAGSSWIPAAALGLALLAIAILAPQLRALGVTPEAAQGVGAAAFVTVGLLFLRAIVRSG